MSTKGPLYVHPASGDQVQTWHGFSWPSFFFGGLWYLAKGLPLYGLLILVMSIFTFGIPWVVGAFIGNELHRKSLISRGYVDEARARAVAPAQPATAPMAVSVADELAKLAKLHADGILTADELQQRKARLLAS